MLREPIPTLCQITIDVFQLEGSTWSRTCDHWIQSEEPTDLGVEFSRGRIPLHRLAMNYSYSNGRIRSYYHSINPMLRNTTGKLEKKTDC